MGSRDSPDPTNANSQNENLESSTEDYGSYDASHDSKRGKLILNLRCVRFVSSIGHKQQFSLAYSDIKGLEKVRLFIFIFYCELQRPDIQFN